MDDKIMFDQNSNLLIIPPYPYSKGSIQFIYYHDHKYSYDDIEALEKLEDDVFKVSINIIDISYDDNNKHKKLLGSTLKQRPSFSMYLRYIPYEMNVKLNQLPEPVLYDFTERLIDRLHEYITLHENLHDYQYFVEEIRDEWLLKWRHI
jgi:hypothetical protein